MRYTVEFSPEAIAHAEVIQAWWKLNRPKAPRLFATELAAALRHVRRWPEAGQLYEPEGVRPTRRLMLPKSRYQIYYWIDDAKAVIRIYAVWHTSRGDGP